jgi:hypothetical protein
MQDSLSWMASTMLLNSTPSPAARDVMEIVQKKIGLGETAIGLSLLLSLCTHKEQ